jgi:type VI secretion system secreted protein Hcp
MSSNFHLKIEGIDGESVDADHKGEIDVQSFSWGLSQSVNISGTGMGVGKPNFQDLHFTHLYDKASPNLAKACAGGKHFATVKFTARKQGDGAKDFFTITLKEAYITSVQPGGSSGGDLTESFSIAYKDIEMEYKTQDSKGALGGGTKFGYDVAANVGRA